MTDDLTDARNRLIPVPRLRHVVTLLNMPHRDKTATSPDCASPTEQQVALYAGIAEWAGLSAQAAEQLTEPDESEVTDRFAFLVEYTDQHAKGWHQAPSAEYSEGITLGDAAEAVARTVVAGYITHLADHRDDYELWLVDSLFLRASVWHLDTAGGHSRGPRPSLSSSAHTFSEARIPPHAVEIRTPIQIHRFLDRHIGP